MLPLATLLSFFPPAGNITATAAPQGVMAAIPDDRSFIANELMQNNGNREVRCSIVNRIASQLSLQVSANKTLAETLLSVLQISHQRPVTFTLAPAALVEAARENCPSAAHLFLSPPRASPPPGLDDDAIATLTSDVTLPDSQLAILRQLTPATLRLLTPPAPSPDDRSSADSLTINTVDYGTDAANISYPTLAELAATAATPRRPMSLRSPDYPPHNDFVSTPEHDR